MSGSGANPKAKQKSSSPRVAAKKPQASFANQVLAAAGKVPHGQLVYGEKALIHHVHAEFAKTLAGKGVSLDQFKHRIANDAEVRMHMTRHDMAQAGPSHAEQAKASTRYMSAEWHTIRVKPRS